LVYNELIYGRKKKKKNGKGEGRTKCLLSKETGKLRDRAKHPKKGGGPGGKQGTYLKIGDKRGKKDKDAKRISELRHQ